MKKMGLMGLMGLMILGTCLALTPKERELVQGLNGINAELRSSVTAQAAQIEKLTTDAVFAHQKIESLSENLISAKQTEEAQLQDLLSQQAKIHALEGAVDFQTKRADKNEAIAKEKTVEAHKSAQERDLFVVAFAILAATAACYVLFPVINKVLNVTFPWTLAWIGAWVFLVGVFYGMERFALRYLINHL